MKSDSLQDKIKILFSKTSIRNDRYLCFADSFSKKEVETEVNPYSILNLRRYAFILQKYMNEYHQFTFNLDSKNCISLQITTVNNPTILSLTFKGNGLVDFLSIESYDNQNESKPFYLQGTIETSNNKKYAYKLERLLNILDVLTYEKNMICFTDKITQQVYISTDIPDRASTSLHKSYILSYIESE